MTIEYSQDGSIVSNTATVEGAPAILISGDDVHFTNTETGRITGTSSSVATIQVTGLRATIINAEGAVITRSSSLDLAILGSAGADVLINDGLLKGRVVLAGGNDSFTQRVDSPNNGSIDLGADNDLFRFEYSGGIGGYTYIPTIAGGSGYDSFVLAGYSIVTDGAGATGFESLDISAGANTRNLLNFSGYSLITLAAGGTYNFLYSANPGVDLSLNGGFVTVGPSSVFRDFSGSDSIETLELNHGTIRNVSLGGGTDSFWYDHRTSANLPAGVIQGVVDGGSGSDWINLSVDGGITVDLAWAVNFENINTGTYTSATSDLRLINANGFSRIDADSDGKLVIGQSYSPNATVGFSFRSTIVLESTATVLHVGNDFSDWVGAITVPDPSNSQIVTNDGTVLGNVRLYTGDDLFDGRLGTVGGSIYGYAGNDHLRGGSNSDRMWGGYGADRLEGNDGDDVLNGEAGGDRLDGGAGDDILTGGAGNDTLISGTGVDQLAGDAGNDVFLFGATLTAADSVSGGDGLDQVVIQGDYAGGNAIVLGSGFAGVESLAILRGSDTRFGDPGTNLHDYNLTLLDGAVAAGVQLKVDASQLLAGEDFIFDGSAETDGSYFVYGGGGADTLTGGAGNDAFYFGEGGQFGASDLVNGGPGGTDQLGLRGSYSITFGANQLVGIDNIGLVSAQDTRFGPMGGIYNYNLTMSDGNVAAGGVMTVDGVALRGGETLAFNGYAEQDGVFRVFGGQGNDTITGGQGGDILAGHRGADTLIGGGGSDSFRYHTAQDSTAAATDQILGFLTGTDSIDLGRIDADPYASGDQAFRWIGSNAFTGIGPLSAGELRAYESGGMWFVEGDIDGDGTADLVISLTLSGGPIVQSDFLL